MCKLENGKKNQSFMSTDSCNIWNQISKKMKLNSKCCSFFCVKITKIGGKDVITYTIVM